ncbi:hypothetical protein [Gleimia coleocanis]|nr:hypothetical protein [Gleimia coleocanis]
MKRTAKIIIASMALIALLAFNKELREIPIPNQWEKYLQKAKAKQEAIKNRPRELKSDFRGTDEDTEDGLEN